MKVSVVVIGDELLLGHVADTNSSYIARAIEPLSWQLAGVEIVGDDADAIAAACSRALERAEIVVTTGGLGPTRDDITKGALMRIFGGKLCFDDDVLANVERIMAERSRPINELTRLQAMVPDTAEVIQNRVGTAPILWFERSGRVLVAMPGVPFETEQMFAEAVLPRLRERFAPGESIAHRSLIVTGISESALAELIEPVESTLTSDVHLAYLPQQGYIHLRIDGRSADQVALSVRLDEVAAAIEALLPAGAVMAHAELTPAQILLEALGSRGLTVATAESCTGGNIAHRITSVPGSSAQMLGGVVAYSNSVKQALLGVRASTLEAHGAVSEPTVIEMSEGVCRATGADVGIATSGIAGPGGAVPGKPVGTVWMAVAVAGKPTLARCVHLPGRRIRVINHATDLALLMAVEAVRR